MGIRSLWTASGDSYGFFELSFSQHWLKTRFITFDDKWKFAEEEQDTVKGSGLVGHCWYIPSDGSKGQECKH